MHIRKYLQQRVKLEKHLQKEQTKCFPKSLQNSKRKRIKK